MRCDGAQFPQEEKKNIGNYRVSLHSGQPGMELEPMKTLSPTKSHPIFFVSYLTHKIHKRYSDLYRTQAL